MYYVQYFNYNLFKKRKAYKKYLIYLSNVYIINDLEFLISINKKLL